VSGARTAARALALVGLAALVVAQTPPSEENILDEVDAPETQAERDLERLGPEKTRGRATQRLKNAVDAVAGGPGMRMPVIGIDQVVKCDDPRMEDLQDAVRYYAKAHGLPSGLDALRDAIDTASAVGRSEVGVGRTAADAAIEERLGKGRWDLFYAMDAIRRVKAAACAGRDTRVGSAGPPGGLGKTAYVAGGAAALALGVLALSGGGGDSTPNNTPPRVDLSSSYGSYAGSLAVTGSTGCVRPGSSTAVQLTLSGNPDGSSFVLNKGGLPFAGTLRADRSFEAEYVGPLSGFFALPSGSSVRWRVNGAVQGSQLAITGTINVTSGACAQNDIQTAVTATKS
jgi:hypothetical protein